MALNHHQVDIVKILAAAKAMCQIVLRIHCRSKFAAQRTLKTNVSIYLLGDRTVLAKTNDRELHRQLIANRAE